MVSGWGRGTPALAAALALALGAIGCGSDGDDDGTSKVVARVGSAAITRGELDRWLAVTGEEVARGIELDAPRFRQCVEDLRAKYRSPPRAGVLLARCRRDYARAKEEALRTLVEGTWIRQEAAARGVAASDAAIDERLERTRPQDDEQERRAPAAPEEARRYRAATEVLEQGLRRQVEAQMSPPTERQLQRYYDQNKEQFLTPERRDADVVIVGSKKQGEIVRRQVERGARLVDIAREVSKDPLAWREGGTWRGLEKESATEVFAAKPGVLTGPVKGDDGWYVFEVTKVTPAEQQPLDDFAVAGSVARALNLQLANERASKHLDDVRAQFRRRTICTVGYVVAELCANAPKRRERVESARRD